MIRAENVIQFVGRRRSGLGPVLDGNETDPPRIRNIGGRDEVVRGEERNDRRAGECQEGGDGAGRRRRRPVVLYLPRRGK